MTLDPEKFKKGRRTFFALDPDTLSLDEVTGFDLYIRSDKGEHTLYHSGKKPFTHTTLAALKKRMLRYLYIEKKDEDSYFQHVDRKLAATLSDGAVPIEKKSAFVYQSVASVMQNVFEDSRAGNIASSKQLVNRTVDFIMKEELATRALLSLTLHDYYTYTHSINVCVFGLGLARRILTPGHDFHTIGFGLLMHDVGKSTIKKRIINKRGPLNHIEWFEMKKHPEKGAQLLASLGHNDEEMQAIVTQHHERFDGKGYPKGLTEDEIHFYAKICTIADVFDALTTERSYHKSVKSFDALTIMKDEMSHDFDPDFFAEFVYMFRN